MPNVVAHSHYQGALGEDWPHDVHICVDHLVDGSVQVWIKANALSGAIERAAQCVDGTLLLRGQACPPEHYIASWRQALHEQTTCTLEAFFKAFSVRLQVRLPRPGDQHQHWLSPEFRPALIRLFGSQTGQSSAEIRSAADIALAMKVLVGVTAYGLISGSLTNSITVTHQAAQERLAA